MSAAKSLIVGVVFLVGAAAAALAQQPLAGHDGPYAGSMTLRPLPQSPEQSYPACVDTRPVSMEIAQGVVTVSYADWQNNMIHYRGQVDGAGNVQAWHTNGDGSRSILTGRIDGATFTGDLDRDLGRCPYSVTMSRH
jgi:hypothetical protein